MPRLFLCSSRLLLRFGTKLYALELLTQPITSLDFCGFPFGFDYVKHEVAEVFDVSFFEASSGDVLEADA
jgi:hypothetical protein